MHRQDDPALAGDVIFLRRIPPGGGRVQWIDGVPVPSSQNFRDQNDEMSVYLASETTFDIALKGHEGFGLVSLSAQQVRDAFAEFNRPVSICRDAENPENGHVLICGKASPGVSRRLKECAQWAPGKWPAKLTNEPT
jgi:hypothetical protein